MKLKFVLVIGLCLCLLSGCSNENPNPKDTQVQSEQENDDTHEAWYTEKEQFELWTESTQYLQTIENPILEGFSLAEYFKCDTRYPAIYDDKYRITFFDYHVEIQDISRNRHFRGIYQMGKSFMEIYQLNEVMLMKME